MKFGVSAADSVERRKLSGSHLILYIIPYSITMSRHLTRILIICTALLATKALAWVGMDMPRLHVEGRYLCDEQGNPVVLHGFGQTYSPWFNEQGNGWGWDKVPSKCLAYNQGLIDKIDQAGWKMQWIRMHMDPYWSNSYGNGNESDISAFSEKLFKQYLDEVFVPMAEYAIAHGLYVVMRPPGVCPERLELYDNYHKYLLNIWSIVTSHDKLKNNPYVMFELANEPINMRGDDGQYTSWSDASFKNCTAFFQAIVDRIREGGANNILWIPGLGYQSQYAGYVKYPIVGDNIGYAVHCYPGWYGSDSEADGGSVEQGVVTHGAGYAEFQAGWNAQVAPIAKQAPILITEMDWAPKKYDKSWGKATTGVAGGVGFGANFKYIMDKTGNVSWMTFTGPEWLAKYDDNAPDGNTFLTDPEACPRPIYRWYQEYADPNWVFVDSLSVGNLDFPSSDEMFNPSIWESGTYDSATRCLTTGQYGFGGWKFPLGIDLSAWKYLVIKLAKAPTSGGWSFRMFDENNYWTDCYQNNFQGQDIVVVPLQEMYRTVNGSVSSVQVDPSHIYIAGFWSYGFTPLYFDHLYLTNSDDYSEEPASVELVIDASADQQSLLYDLYGRPVSQPKRGQFYVVGNRRGKVKVYNP